MTTLLKKLVPEPIVQFMRFVRSIYYEVIEAFLEIIRIPILVSPCSYKGLLRAYLYRGEISAEQPLVEIWLRNPAQKIYLRLGDSDLDVFRQVILRQQYGYFLDFTPKTIIDAGANVGYTSVFLSRRFPDAEIIAIEPDPENYELLQTNLSDSGANCRFVNGAVWHEKTELNLHRGDFRDGRHWASQVSVDKQSSHGAVPTYTIDELVQQAGWKTIDLLKMDIEGAELQVFRDGSTKFLAATRCCMVEVHDHSCYTALVDALSPYQYKLNQRSEVTIARQQGEIQKLKTILREEESNSTDLKTLDKQALTSMVN